MDKLPSTGNLGLIHSAFRIPRAQEWQQIENLRNNAQVYHGYERMEHGQRHFMSTATTYNVHVGATKAGEAGSVIAITGTSGRFINPFGEMTTMTDGAEVLYPPGTISTYGGTRRDGPKSMPVHTFTEIEPGALSNPVVIEDKDYHPVRLYNLPPQQQRLDYPEGTPYEPYYADIPQRSTIRKRI